MRVVEPDRLGGPALRNEICDALTDSRSRIRRAVACHLDLDGARRAAVHLLALADRPVDGSPTRRRRLSAARMTWQHLPRLDARL